MRYLERHHVIAIHDQIISVIGGASGLRESDLLDSIIVKPQSSIGGKALYPTLFIKIAAVYEALCNYHVFIDGNKRTAAITMFRLLVINEYDLTATNAELAEYTLFIAVAHPSLEDIADWIEQHSRKVIP